MESQYFKVSVWASVFHILHVQCTIIVSTESIKIANINLTNSQSVVGFGAVWSEFHSVATVLIFQYPPSISLYNSDCIGFPKGHAECACEVQCVGTEALEYIYIYIYTLKSSAVLENSH